MHYASSTKLLIEATTKTARTIELLEAVNYDTKIIQTKITLAAYFHFKQVWAPKQAKEVNIEDAQSIKLSH